ncbi:hypothetical protein C5C13_07315 [Clavibacter michiganensis]|nr:hypothetical protein C5C13_07315 [Clavibacter michiganensis]
MEEDMEDLRASRGMPEVFSLGPTTPMRQVDRTDQSRPDGDRSSDRAVAARGRDDFPSYA